MPDHATAERRSLRYHSAIALRLAQEPAIQERALSRTQRWLKDGSVPDYYARGWQEILGRGSDELRAFLVEGSERARAFRQVSPFAGALSPKERWQLWAEDKSE